MKNALISPNEPVQSGYRIAEVSITAFEVALPLFWVTCTDDVVADKFWYDPKDEAIKPIPEPPTSTIVAASDQPVVTGANLL